MRGTPSNEEEREKDEVREDSDSADSDADPMLSLRMTYGPTLEVVEKDLVVVLVKDLAGSETQKGRDGTTMTCRICNSEEHFAARCPQGKGGDKGSGLPSATFHVAESRQASGQLTWPGMIPDEEVDGPLALLIRDLGAYADHAFMATHEQAPMEVYPLEAADPWARPAADRQMRRNSAGASPSWGSWIPVQMPTAASLGKGVDTQQEEAISQRHQ